MKWTQAMEKFYRDNTARDGAAHPMTKEEVDEFWKRNKSTLPLDKKIESAIYDDDISIAAGHR